MTVFVFGAGPLGRYLSENLAKKGFCVSLLSASHEVSPSKSPNSRVKDYGEISLVDLSSTTNLAILTTRMDLVSSEVNLRIMKDIKYLLNVGCHVLNFSSVAVYGTNPLSRKESNSPKPTSHYGEVKLQIENDLGELGDPQLITNLRISNLFGLFEFEDFTNTVIRKIVREESLHLPKLSTFRDFVHISDLLSFVEYWGESPHCFHGILNFATGNSTSLEDWALAIASSLNRDLTRQKDLHDDYTDSFIDNTSILSLWSHKFCDQRTPLIEYVDSFKTRNF